MNQNERDAERARLNRMDIIDSKLSRRDMFKYGLLTAGGLLAAKSGLSIRAAGAADMVSPRTTPWTGGASSAISHRHQRYAGTYCGA